MFTVHSILSAFQFYVSTGHFICGKTKPSVLLIKIVRVGGGGETKPIPKI